MVNIQCITVNVEKIGGIRVLLVSLNNLHNLRHFMV